MATYTENDKNIYIFYDNIGNDIQQAVNSVLEMMNVSTKNLTLLEGYIHNGNTTKTMSYMSRRRNLAKVKKKLVLEWAELSEETLSRIDDTEILYRLLTARGSYDIFCPICADIPLELFDYGEDTKKKHSRQIILLENENPYKEKGPRPKHSGREMKLSAMPTEVDLRGMDSVEAICVLERYLDEAMRSNVSPVRIIHGKGTGAVRAAVHQSLKRNKFIKKFRLGMYGEGEDGVTIAEFG